MFRCKRSECREMVNAALVCPVRPSHALGRGRCAVACPQDSLNDEYAIEVRWKVDAEAPLGPATAAALSPLNYDIGIRSEGGVDKRLRKQPNFRIDEPDHSFA